MTDNSFELTKREFDILIDRHIHGRADEFSRTEGISYAKALKKARAFVYREISSKWAT